MSNPPLPQPMAQWTLRTPRTPAALAAYYDLRWRVLRQPWNQPRGSEQDEREPTATHVMAVTGDQTVIGVARLHGVDALTGQIRFMAVDPAWERQGIASALLHHLVAVARDQGLTELVLNARATAVGFYTRHSFVDAGAAPPVVGVLHRRMWRPL